MFTVPLGGNKSQRWLPIGSGAESTHPIGEPGCVLGLSGVRVVHSLVCCVIYCRSLFVLLYFFFWPLCCLSFDSRLLILLSRFKDVDCNGLYSCSWSSCGFLRRLLLGKVWRYLRGNQKPWIEGQTTQWPKEKVQKNKQWSTINYTTN
jgi:hypothetical protein